MSEKIKLALTVQFPDKRMQKQFPGKLLKSVVQAALVSSSIQADITLRFVNAEEGRKLNREFRGKDYATNVLTFAYGEQDIQADIILCTDVLQQEAVQQHKPILAHTLHLIVHGVLHAQGFDHEEEEEAAEMEGMEVEILARLGVSNPYEV
jgi:probable rRNA maturation factor